MSGANRKGLELIRLQVGNPRKSPLAICLAPAKQLYTRRLLRPENLEFP
jgi:hypothetical protein